jgi:hypothetical protein
MGFGNERLERRPFSVNLRRLESPGGKSLEGGWILGRWSCEMRFKKISSSVEGECPSNAVARKARGKGFGMLACQSVV